MDNRLHEENKYKYSTFPFEIYRVNQFSMTPKGRGFDDLHWHEELQFTIAEKGPLRMQVNGELVFLAEGEGLFISPEVLHTTKTMQTDGSYYSLNVQTKILSFFLGSLMEQKYVLPYLKQQRWLHLNQGDLSQEKILSQIKQINQIYLNQSDFAWEYQIAVLLVSCWQEIIQAQEQLSLPADKKQLQHQKRMQSLLNFVQENYMRELRLSEMAQAAHISISECTRSFKKFTDYSPYEYLLQYRIKKAAEKLLQTELTVEQIAIQTGFKDASSFIQAFKRRVGLTPLKYRKNYQN
ncbi:helix-turn-helix domain-containing protein [Enterococcus alishanensis]